MDQIAHWMKTLKVVLGDTTLTEDEKIRAGEAVAAFKHFFQDVRVGQGGCENIHTNSNGNISCTDEQIKKELIDEGLLPSLKIIAFSYLAGPIADDERQTERRLAGSVDALSTLIVLINKFPHLSLQASFDADVHTLFLQLITGIQKQISSAASGGHSLINFFPKHEEVSLMAMDGITALVENGGAADAFDTGLFDFFLDGAVVPILKYVEFSIPASLSPECNLKLIANIFSNLATALEGFSPRDDDLELLFPAVAGVLRELQGLNTLVSAASSRGEREMFDEAGTRMNLLTNILVVVAIMADSDRGPKRGSIALAFDEADPTGASEASRNGLLASMFRPATAPGYCYPLHFSVVCAHKELRTPMLSILWSVMKNPDNGPDQLNYFLEELGSSAYFVALASPDFPPMAPTDKRTFACCLGLLASPFHCDKHFLPHPPILAFLSKILCDEIVMRRHPVYIGMKEGGCDAVCNLIKDTSRPSASWLEDEEVEARDRSMPLIVDLVIPAIASLYIYKDIDAERLVAHFKEVTYEDTEDWEAFPEERAALLETIKKVRTHDLRFPVLVQQMRSSFEEVILKRYHEVCRSEDPQMGANDGCDRKKLYADVCQLYTPLVLADEL